MPRRAALFETKSRSNFQDPSVHVQLVILSFETVLNTAPRPQAGCARFGDSHRRGSVVSSRPKPWSRPGSSGRIAGRAGRRFRSLLNVSRITSGRFRVSWPCSTEALHMTAMPSCLRRFEQSQFFPSQRLVGRRERFAHAEIERQLNDFEMVLFSAGLFRQADHHSPVINSLSRRFRSDSHSTSLCRRDEFVRSLTACSKASKALSRRSSNSSRVILPSWVSGLWT